MIKILILTLAANAYWRLGPKPVVINDATSEYHRCNGLLVDVEKVPGSEETLTTIVRVVCPNKKQYEYIVGLPLHRLLPKE